MLVCVQRGYKGPESRLLLMEVSTSFFIYVYKNTTSHYSFSILIDGTPYFMRIMWTVDDMELAFHQEIKRWKFIKYFLSID